MSAFSPGAFLPEAFSPDALLFSPVEPAYSVNALSIDAFSINAFSFDISTPATPTDTGIAPSGGFPAYEPLLRTRRDISKARERLGLKDRFAEETAARIIADVAARQAQTLELDEQKRFEELSRQLQIEGLQFDARYLELLNQARGRLIDAEIATRLRRILDDEEIVLMLLLAAAV